MKKINWKNCSTFQKTCVIVTIILIVAIIVQIGIMIGLKQKIDSTKQKNEEIESTLPPDDDASANAFGFDVLFDNQLE